MKYRNLDDLVINMPCEDCPLTDKCAESCLATWQKYKDLVDGCDQTAKQDAGKLQLSLVPAQIIRDIAEVRMYGNKKYGDSDSWKTVEMQRYIDAFYRHFLAFLEDKNSKDEESGIEHYKHMACNIAFICWMMVDGEQDNYHPTREEIENDY